MTIWSVTSSLSTVTLPSADWTAALDVLCEGRTFSLQTARVQWLWSFQALETAQHLLASLGCSHLVTSNPGFNVQHAARMLKLDVGIWRTKELPSGVIKLGREILIKGWFLWQSYLQIEEFPLPWFDDTGGYSLAPAFSSSRPRSTAAALTTDSVKRSQAPRVRKSKSPKLKPALGRKKFYFQTTCPRHLTSCWYSMRCCNSSVFWLKIDPVTDQSSGGSLC